MIVCLQNYGVIIINYTLYSIGADNHNVPKKGYAKKHFKLSNDAIACRRPWS